MRSPFRNSRTADRLARSVAAVVAVTVLAGCGSSDPELAGSDEPAVAVDAPDRVLTGFGFESNPDLTDYKVHEDVQITVIDHERSLDPGP